MMQSALDECFRTLRIADGDREKFRKAMISGLENDQTYHRDLLDIPEKDVRAYAIDFFLDTSNLSDWWPSWTIDQYQTWLSIEHSQIEQALLDLFEHWSSNKREGHRRNGSLDGGTRNKPKTPKSRVSTRKSAHTRNAASTSRNVYVDIDEAMRSEEANSPASSTSAPRSANRQSFQANDTQRTLDLTNKTLPDIPYHEQDVETPPDDEDSIPMLHELLHGDYQARGRQASQTIEPLSPKVVDKGKQPERHADASYVASQMSTIGQPPISPPPTRHAAKRKQSSQIDEEESDDEPIISPLAKRNRSSRNMQVLENPMPTDVGTIDQDDHELSQLLVQMSSQLSQLSDGVSPTTRNQNDNHDANITATDDEFQPHQPGIESDSFVDLARMLHQYLRDCKATNLKRANESTLSPRDVEKLHIRAGILEHLYCDVTSRIKAVAAKRKGKDKSKSITSHTLYS